jgi:MFS family permease
VNLESVLPVLLTVQGVIGGADTLVNHELVERLPSRPDARTEIGLHAIREAIYGVLFCGLAWYAWHGWIAFVIVALLAAEVAVTASDEYVENHTRVLPQNERVLHVFLTLNFGALIALLAPLLSGWLQQPDGWSARDFGAWSWALTAFGVASLCWSVRDLLAWRSLRRMKA